MKICIIKLGEYRIILPQIVEHTHKRHCAAEVDEKAKAEPKPGIVGDLFVFIAQIHFPEVSGSQ